MRQTGIFIGLFVVIAVCLGQSDLRNHAGSIAENNTQAQTPLYQIIRNGKFGFIDNKGKVVIAPTFDDVEDFSEGLALVTLDRKKFFIDRSGRVAIETKDFEPINGFTEGRARGNVTTRSPYTKGYIDKSGEVVIDDGKIWGACVFSEGLACVVTGKWGFIDTSGKFVIKPQFDEAGPFSEGLATVRLWDQSKASSHKTGFIDRSGKVVIKPVFDVAQRFSEGLAAVGTRRGTDDYQFGFIDKTGMMIIKPRFDWTYSFEEGMAAVRVSEKWGFIDKTGKMLIKPRFDKAEGFSDGFAAVAVKGKWGFIDNTGKFVIEPRFNEAGSFRNGLAFVKISGYDAYEIVDVIGHFDREGKWGYIDKTGKYIWEPTN